MVVVTAGTADLPVAAECTAVLGALGFAATLLADCGVAGLHRLLAELDTIAAADVVVVVAGMEGALASVIGGLTPAPVVAVPTSTGYGAALEGVTALLSMLSACSSGITVVGSTTGTAQRAPWPGSSRDRPRLRRPRRWRGSTASPVSPATWPWAP